MGGLRRNLSTYRELGYNLESSGGGSGVAGMGAGLENGGNCCEIGGYAELLATPFPW